MKIKQALVLISTVLIGISAAQLTARNCAYLVETSPCPATCPQEFKEFKQISREFKKPSRSTYESPAVTQKNDQQFMRLNRPMLVADRIETPVELLRMRPKHIREKKRRLLLKKRITLLERQIGQLEGNLKPRYKALKRLKKQLNRLNQDKRWVRI